MMGGPHPDRILHNKLSQLPSSSLYDALKNPETIQHLTAHFDASQMSYSTQAHRVNVLFDTLLRPNGDLDISDQPSPIHWEKSPQHRVDHLVLGRASEPGGQWSETMSCSNARLRTLSYADMLSLPGYTFADFFEELYGREMPPFTRPTRQDVSRYYAVYPSRTGITSAIAARTYVFSVSRQPSHVGGFLIRAVDYSGKHPTPISIYAAHVVLASGIFTNPIAIPAPLRQIPDVGAAGPSSPLLVVGTGFTAADVVLSHQPYRRVIHIFKWNPTDRPSPLKACHPGAYPEYAGIYRQMKLAACQSSYAPEVPGNAEEIAYEGMPNGEIVSCRHDISGGLFMVGIRLPGSGQTVYRTVGALAHHIGRKGDLSYLSPALQSELGLTPETARAVSGDTLRRQVARNVQVTSGVFVVGSLTGDSLVKFGLGSGVASAAGICADRLNGATITTDERSVAVRGGGRLSPPSVVAPVGPERKKMLEELGREGRGVTAI